MKVKKLNIKSYRYLENVNFDFTYPEGHEKAGQPLDKICIIGQSATGKTGILELLKHNVSMLTEMEVANGKQLFGYPDLKFDGQLEFSLDSGSILIKNDHIVRNGNVLPVLENGGGSISRLVDESIRLLYFSSEIISKEVISVLDKNPLDILTLFSEQPPKVYTTRYGYLHDVHEFSYEFNKELWLSLLNQILEYRKRFTQFAAELLKKGAIADLDRLNRQYKEWTSANENPLISFAKNFNPVLGKLNLEVDLSNTEYPVPIRSKINDEIVPISGLSTGTKGLLLSLFPLSQLDTDQSIIIVDEPERSLFPDLQIDLISHYQKLAPTAQFIVATHSPFIAAAFEPEERFILYFDIDGKVVVRKGESPIGDDPNDMLRNDFDVDYYNKFGKEAYQRYLDLKRRMSQETEPDKKKDLLVELTKLGDKYNF